MSGERKGHSARSETIGSMLALVTFASLSLFPLLLFSQSSKEAGLYRVCGWLMLACLALIGVYALLPEVLRQALAPRRPVLLLEWVLVWVFGYSWFEKGRESAMRRVVSPPMSV